MQQTATQVTADVLSPKQSSALLAVQDFLDSQLTRVEALLKLIHQNGEETEHGFKATDEDIATLVYWAAKHTAWTKEHVSYLIMDVRHPQLSEADHGRA